MLTEAALSVGCTPKKAGKRDAIEVERFLELCGNFD